MMKQEWLKARLQPRLQQCKRAAGFVRSPANSVFLRRACARQQKKEKKEREQKNSGGWKCKTWNLELLLSIIYSASEWLHSGSGVFTREHEKVFPWQIFYCFAFISDPLWWDSSTAANLTVLRRIATDSSSG